MRALERNILAAVVGAMVGNATWISAAAAGGEAKSYIVEFEEDGLFHSAAGLRQRKVPIETRGESASAFDGGRVDVDAPQSRDYLRQLQVQQATHLAAIGAAIGRQGLKVTHYYNIALSGVSLELTEAEAAQVAKVPGVRTIAPTPMHDLLTFRGPSFIKADTIWNGSSVPGGVGNRGAGQVLAVLDGGTHIGHPSFADDASCGFSAANPKLRSAIDCMSTDVSGACNGAEPNDRYIGHGVHVASIAAGNTVTTSAVPTPPLAVPYTQMSGVAPCAAIRSYKICDAGGCGGNATLAAIDNLMAAGDVTALNYSVGLARGTSLTNPWSSGQNKEFLPAVQAGVFAAAAAGNTSLTVTDPVGAVVNQGPWMATVAAVTQDEIMTAGISATGPGTPPANTQGIYLKPGTTTKAPVAPINADILTYPANIEGCTDAVAATPGVPDSGTPGGGFPAGYFAGGIALIQRGDCSFSVKINNALGAGAIGVVIYNNLANFGSVSMNTAAVTSSDAKAWFIEGPSGRALRDLVASSAPTAVPGRIDPIALGIRQGDVLGSFSLRGPVAGVTDITKPDIGAPGVDILGAQTAALGNYGLMSGTSMASPHVAGAGMLLKAVHPDWTPAEVKSAMMLTAVSGSRENGTTPWNADDVGSGRLDLDKAVRAGFVMNVASYFPDNSSRPGLDDQRAMNFASLRNTVCSKATGCNWTRIVRGVLPKGNWSATVANPSPDIVLSVSPSTFTLASDRIYAYGFDTAPTPHLSPTQSLTITAQPGANATVSTATWWFGKVTFTEADNQSPPLTMTVAVKVAN